MQNLTGPWRALRARLHINELRMLSLPGIASCGTPIEIVRPMFAECRRLLSLL
jgi:hypothetical protein